MTGPPAAPPPRTAEVLGLVRHDTQQPRAERLTRPEPGQVPERLHERLLHDVVGFFPGAQQERSPVRAQRVPGDQHAIGVKVTVAGPGYRLRVLDDTPHSTEHTYLNTPP
jgi:hypothetical protein